MSSESPSPVTNGDTLEKATDQFTFHREPARVGGERYVRCETCGAECVPADPDRLSHRDGCTEGRQ